MKLEEIQGFKQLSEMRQKQCMDLIDEVGHILENVEIKRVRPYADGVEAVFSDGMEEYTFSKVNSLF